jgi:DNA polymerase III subunit epsilon
MEIQLPKLSIKLQRPLVFFDLETTGTDVATDRIVEMAFIKLMPDGSSVMVPNKAEGQGRLIVNPGQPIPPEATAIHGISDADAAVAKTFTERSEGLNAWLEGCDFAGYNSNRFDVPILVEEFLRAGVDFSLEGRSLVDVQTIFHKMEPRNLRAALGFFCGESLEDAHEAMPDVVATLKVFASQIERYKDHTVPLGGGESLGPLPQEVVEIAAFAQHRPMADAAGKFGYDESGEVVFNFGQHKGKLLRENMGYAEWMLGRDFAESTKRLIREVVEQHKQKK